MWYVGMSRADQLLKQAEEYQQLAEQQLGQLSPPLQEPVGGLRTFYRVQPTGKSLDTHTSGLAYDKVPGLFAFEHPDQLFDTYTWLHVRKAPEQYEMIRFLGKVVDRPADSEGVVVKPDKVLQRTPLVDWLKAN